MAQNDPPGGSEGTSAVIKLTLPGAVYDWVGKKSAANFQSMSGYVRSVMVAMYNRENSQ